MPWNPRSLVLFISVTLGFQLALVHAIKFPTVKRAPNPPPSYFSFIKRDPESAFLTDEEVRNDPLFRFGDDLPLSDNASTLFHEALPRACKHIPGDKAWPSKITWDALNATVGGVLVRPSPIGKACYIDEGEYDASRCDTVKNSWSDSDLHANHPSSIMAVLYQGLTCMPDDGTLTPVSAHTCQIGGYPVYVINAESVRDIQAGVNFARNSNIRLVIKNTGHDFSGKSSGFGSLSIRTHKFKSIDYIQNYNRNGYRGPALKVGAGVQAFELYARANQLGHTVVGGEGMTVGWGGGYIQGGGHSPLSSIHGMGADHVLAFDVVLSNGRYVTATATENSDIFWALRGGGGSTFGVVVSITVKALPDLPVTISIWNFTSSSADIAKYADGDFSNNDFWAVVREYFLLFETHANMGIYTYFNIFPDAVAGAQRFTMLPVFAPHMSIQKVNDLFAPVYAKAKKLSITLEPQTTAYSGFYDAWQAGFPKEIMGVWTSQPGSRLFPRSIWHDATAFDKFFDVFRRNVPKSFFFGFNIAPTLAAGGHPDNAVNPAWRNTLFHAITFSAPWDASIRDGATLRQLQKEFTDGIMSEWRSVSPGAGSYPNESDINEPNWQQSFFGTNYPRLYKIKGAWDPLGVFFAETAVGSEDWSAGIDKISRLCRV